MPPGPAHARQRRRRLLVLITTLLLVAALSPRLQENFVPPADEVERPYTRSLDTLALASAHRSATVLMRTRAGEGPVNERALFSFIDAPADAALLEQQSPVPASEIYYVELNHALLAGKGSAFWQPGSRLTIPLPGGRSVEVEIETSETLGPDSFTSTGHIVGVPEGRAIFGYHQGRLSARFENLPEGDFQLRSLDDPNGKSINQIYVVDPTLIPNCGGQPEIEVGPETPMHYVEGGGKTTAPIPEMAGDEVEPTEIESLVSGQAIVDVLMVYTSAVRKAHGSEAALMAEINLGIAKVNSDFASSGITGRVRLAGTLEVDYPEDALPGSAGDRYQATTLDRLRQPDDKHMDEVHRVRDEVGADLVCLLVRRNDNESAGIAYLLNEPRGYLGALYAYSVVNSSLVSGAQAVLSHELGHNFGCAHARQDEGAKGTKDGAYSYSYAYRFKATNTSGSTRDLRTLMAYSPGDRIPYFSNPRLTLPNGASYNGYTYRLEPEPALGVAEGSNAAADNARTIEQNAFQVASYRVSADYGSAGTLVNVSTLAHVSTSQGMNAGFVIEGSGSKRVLVRAVGPTLSLAPFNVPGAVTDPTLEVYRQQTLIRSNDDWWRDAAAGSSVMPRETATAAFSAAGAFSLPPNSADAALVLDLPAGAYSASILAKSGSGRAIAEVYELDSTGSRIVNLSTLAFGSVAQPIVAGIVVRADPEQPAQRKRMFIRVQGPSLTKHGVANAMADPRMRLYDSRGNLVLEVDDWDPPTTTFSGSDLPIVRRGEVDQASEREVFEAMKRVGGGALQPTEPAVVVELPPGLYSLRVEPFEELPSQPARPGVALVEVFELSGNSRDK